MGRLSAWARQRPAHLCAAAMLLAALADWPYGYYTFMRLVVCLAGGLLAFQFFQGQRVAWAIAMTGLALLFNPFVLVHFERHQWALIDVAAALVFLLAPAATGRKPGSPAGKPR